MVVRIVLLVAALAAGACGGAAAQPPQILVFAAASLADACEALATSFEEANPGRTVRVHRAGTPTLVLQLREGAPADVFVSADPVHMERVVGLGLTAGAPQTLARNRLALVVPAGNPAGLGALEDLGRPDLAVALCGPAVPAGRYARAALAAAGVEVRPVTEESSVKGVVTKLALGEVDAGVVYATDAAASRAVEEVPVPALAAAVATCPAAPLSAGRAGDGGALFLAHARSARGRAILEGLGFLVP